MLDNKQGIIEWYKTYLELGFNLGFDLNDIKHAYLNKNAINYQRQTNNY
jgi:dimeric dUTPase (all-alpha-NTP-PPase superfamily)